MDLHRHNMIKLTIRQGTTWLSKRAGTRLNGRYDPFDTSNFNYGLRAIFPFGYEYVNCVLLSSEVPKK